MPDPSPDSLNRTAAHAPEPDPTGSTDPTAALSTGPTAPAPPTGLPAVPGYEVLGEIARGGMGRVLAARDPVLDREVAVKVLLRPDPDGEMARRFVTESKVTARLPHPNIPPVYALGRLLDGSPFLAMKLIQGHTLAARLAARSSPADDLPGLVRVFEQVCQAVAFAHRRGILHRDLKPANVMVGAFGEVQVMDWGLAKTAAAPAQHRVGTALDYQPPADALVGPEDADHTRAGRVLGTPAYIAPEQARGEPLGPQADVFALGGMLYEILTGRRTFAGRSGAEALSRAKAGDVADARGRLDGCGADPELIELAKSCLNPGPADRPADAGAVADGVLAYRAGVEDRLRAAERDRAAAEARAAEQRRKRQWQLAAVVAVGLLVIGGGAAVWRAGDQEAQARAKDLEKELEAEQRAAADRDRRVRNAEAVAALLDRCEEAFREDDATKAGLALEAAEKRAAEGGAEHLADRLTRRRADLVVLQELNAVDRVRWDLAGRQLPEWKAVTGRFRATLARFGADPDEVRPEDAAARVGGSAVRDRLVRALDRVAEERSPTVRATLRLVDPDPFRDAVRDAIQAGNTRRVIGLAGQPEAMAQPPGFAAFLGDVEAVPVERRRALLEAAVGRHPRDPGLPMTLGQTYPIQRRPGAGERVRWYSLAVAAAPDNPLARTKLGIALYDLGDLAGAEAAFRQAIRIDSTYANAHCDLGNILRVRQDLAGAEAEFREAIRLAPGNAVLHLSLGLALGARKNPAGAEAEIREAVRLDPKSAAAQRHLGEVLLSRGDKGGAEAAFRALVELEPENALARVQLGTLLMERNERAGAEAAFRAAIRIDPKFASPHVYLGDLLQLGGDPASAEVEFRAAIRIDPNYAHPHLCLGRVLQSRGDLGGAEAAFREAIRIDPKYTDARWRLGDAMQSRGERIGAEAEFRTLVELEPTNAAARVRLGSLLQERGDGAGAEAELREAIRLVPNYAHAHLCLGTIFQYRDDRAGAEAEFRAAIRFDPKYAHPHLCLGDLLQLRGNLAGAEAEFRAAVRIDPKYAEAHLRLGKLLESREELDGAIGAYRAAIATAPGNATARRDLDRALKRKTEREDKTAPPPRGPKG